MSDEGTKLDSSELLPCPFCGSSNLDHGDNWSCGDGYVHCNGCGCTMSSFADDREQDAMRKWNDRKGNKYF